MSNLRRVIALISTFNESDIIEPAIAHLVANGVDVYLLDNHSTDDTRDRAGRWLGRGLLEIELFPPGSKGDVFDWEAILHRKEQLASELDANWFMHHDADEFRESPWPGTTLKEAIEWVDNLGFNCIDYRVLNFRPVDDGYQPGHDPQTYFEYYEEGAEYDRMQLKTWKAAAGVTLGSGGHQAVFEGRRIFPIPFLLRHYPIRGQTHGARKVFSERKGRFLASEHDKGWHRQYDAIQKESHRFLYAPDQLRRFDLDQARLENLLPEAMLQNLSERLLRTDEEFETHRRDSGGELNEYRKHTTNLEADRARLQEHVANLEADRTQLQQHVGNLEEERGRFREHVSNLEADRERLQEHIRNLETEHGRETQALKSLEEDRARMSEDVRNLAGEREVQAARIRSIEAEHKMALDEIERLAAAQKKAGEAISTLENELNRLRASRSWRWTAAFRRLGDALRLK